MQRLRDRHEQDAGLGQLGLEGGRHRDRIEHRVDRDAAIAARLAILTGVAIRLLDTQQRFALAQRNAEFFVGAQDFGIDLVERLGSLLPLRRGVVIDVLVIDRAVLDLGPFRLAHGQPAPVGVEPPRQHPFGLVLLRRNEPDGVFAKALGSLLGFDQRLEPILVLVNVDTTDLIDGLLHGRHSSLRSRFQGPRVGLSRLWRCSGSDLSSAGSTHSGRLNYSNGRQFGRLCSHLGRDALPSR